MVSFGDEPSHCDVCFGSGIIPGPYAGFTDEEGRWTGKVELIPSQLEIPLHWRKPRRIAVGLMGDLFHPNLPDDARDRVFAVMALCPQHRFLVLTKRAREMREYFASGEAELLTRYGNVWDGMERGGISVGHCTALSDWPLPNVHLGISASTQAELDERAEWLRKTPAAVSWVSLEPLLEKVDTWQYLGGKRNPIGEAFGARGLDWVVVGGETGPGARPCDLAWIRGALRDAQAAGVPAFVKQLGARPAELCDRCDPSNRGFCRLYGATLRRDGFDGHGHDGLLPMLLKDSAGADPAEWPADLRVRQMPRAHR